MKNKLKIGDKIFIKNNLKNECNKLGIKISNSFLKEFSNSTREVMAIWEDRNIDTIFISVDLCVEIPIQCCELIDTYEEYDNYNPYVCQDIP